MYAIHIALLLSFTALATGAKVNAYWDCCKTGCSWTGKADVTAPVASCAKDGSTRVAASTGSACESGSAFACTNIDSWAVNASFAYGFVAFSPSSGGTAATLCCSCYSLTLASGKKAEVQVVNSDSLKDTFVFAIPGGGVGDYEACDKQWGAPKDGWGKRYGGVQSDAECSQLPASLQAGCHFRFNWLKSDYGAAATFTKIKCPSVLTSRSGCTRHSE